MPVLDQQTILARYQRGVSAGGTAYREGVTGRGQAWQQAAASDASEARYATEVQRAVQARSRQRAVAQVSPQAWETAAQNIGAANYQASAARATANYQAVVQNIVAGAQAAQNAANSVPGATLADRLNRSREAAIAMHRYWAGVNGEQPEV